MALSGVQREFPAKLDHVMNDASDARMPRELHPAFYGCFDWHSAVHTHWLMARLLRLAPDIPQAAAMRRVLDEHLTSENIAAEARYLSRPNAGSFERTYGWAWLLKLCEECARAAAAGIARADAWCEALAPLADAFVQRYMAYLPRLDYPIRTGVHANTAFGLAFAHDWAERAGHDGLHMLIRQKALAMFGRDEAYPAHLEPGGADFFSPALMEAELMRRVMTADDFVSWFERFLPGARDGLPRTLFEPARVSDREDLQIVHLDGLNLSRAWCMRGIAGALPDGPTKARLETSAPMHLDSALPHVASGQYAGEHWLGTFALLAVTGAD